MVTECHWAGRPLTQQETTMLSGIHGIYRHERTASELSSSLSGVYIGTANAEEDAGNSYT